MCLSLSVDIKLCCVVCHYLDCPSMYHGKKCCAHQTNIPEFQKVYVKVIISRSPEALCLQVVQVNFPPKCGGGCHQFLGRLEGENSTPCIPGKGPSTIQRLLREPEPSCACDVCWVNTQISTTLHGMQAKSSMLCDVSVKGHMNRTSKAYSYRHLWVSPQLADEIYGLESSL